MRKSNSSPLGEPLDPGKEVEAASGKGMSPARMCGITRRSYPKNHLLRFVVGPEGGLVEDLAGKLPGRGQYVNPAKENIVKLLKRSGLRGAAIDPHLERIEQSLLRRLLDGLNLARRAGDLRWGVRSVKELVDGVQTSGAGDSSQALPSRLWLLASDAAVHSREKIDQQCRKMALITGSDPEIFEILDRSRFGQVCGGGEVAVLIVSKAGMVNRVRGDVVRFQSFLSG